MQKFEVLFYTKEDGSKPAQDFILRLEPKMQVKMLKTVKLLAQNGFKLREPYSKALGDGIFELRAKVGSDISRVLYFFIINNQIVLTNGFIKKTNQTPQAEIKKAKQYRLNFLNRKENEK